jgi:hypothetical protein
MAAFAARKAALALIFIGEFPECGGVLDPTITFHITFIPL